MAHILCMTTGLTGMLFASLEVVRRLREDGHRVTYACPWDVGERVAAQGVDYRQLPQVRFEPAPQADSPGGLFAPIHAWATGPARRRAGLVNLGMEEFAEQLAELRPDLILMDTELCEHVMTAASAGYNIALLNPWFAFRKRPGLPPINRDITPDIGRARTELSWLWLRTRRSVTHAMEALRTGRTDRRSILLGHARRVGFPRRGIEANGWLKPLSFRSLTILSMTAQEMDFPHPARPGAVYVGPMIGTHRSGGENTRELDEVIRDARRRGRRVIYCSVSSKDRGDRAFLTTLSRAVSERSDWSLVIALGSQIRREDLEVSAENVRAFEWVPQLHALASADCSINHAGIHSVNECMHFRVPMLVCSGKRYDQDGVSARVRFHGLGLTADKDTTGPSELRDRIHRVLTDEAIQRRIDEMQDRIELYKRNRRLEEAVASLLKHPPRGLG